jgi:hypothetical protein
MPQENNKRLLPYILLIISFFSIVFDKLLRFITNTERGDFTGEILLNFLFHFGSIVCALILFIKVQNKSSGYAMRFYGLLGFSILWFIFLWGSLYIMRQF